MSSEPVPYTEGPIPWIPADVMSAFPLSGPIHRYMHWATQVTDTPALFHLGALLPALTTRLAWTHISISKDVPMRLWCLMVAGAGFGKSTPLKMAQKFVTDHINECGGGPHERTMIRFEGTVQGLFGTIQEAYVPDINKEIALIHTDEAAPILTQKYQDSAGKFFCQLYDGEMMERHTATLQKAARMGEIKKPKLHHPLISASFACTTDEFEQTASKTISGNGLLSRFMTFHAVPDRLLFEQRPFPEIRQQTLDVWQAWWGALDGRRVLGEEAEVLFAAEASTRLRERVFEPLALRVRKDANDALFATVRRGMSHVQTVAALYALSQGRFEVNALDMQQAIELFEHTLTFTRDKLPRLGQGEHGQLRDRILGLLGQAGDEGLAKGTMYKALGSPLKMDLDRTLESLVDADEVVAVREPGRGRPSQRYFRTDLLPPDVTTQN